MSLSLDTVMCIHTMVNPLEHVERELNYVKWHEDEGTQVAHLGYSGLVQVTRPNPPTQHCNYGEAVHFTGTNGIRFIGI